jgi:hypothetical protein
METKFISIETISKLREVLLDVQAPLAKRFRCLFTLKNIGGKDAVEALTSGLILIF